MTVSKGESLLKYKIKPITNSSDPLQKIKDNIEKLKSEFGRKSGPPNPRFPTKRGATDKSLGLDSDLVQKCLVTVMEVENKILMIDPDPARKSNSTMKSSKLGPQSNDKNQRNIQEKSNATKLAVPSRIVRDGQKIGENIAKFTSRQTKIQEADQNDTEDIISQLRSRKKSILEADDLSERSRKIYIPMSEEPLHQSGIVESISRKRPMPKGVPEEIVPSKRKKTDSEKEDWLDSKLDLLLEVFSL